MKRFFTVMMVLALIGGAAFARGNSEYGNGSRQGTGVQYSPANGEEVSLSGTVDEIDGQVVLKTADGIYSLSAPGFYRAGVEIPYGETIEVRGSETEVLTDCDIDAEGHIFVDTARVNGEELSFSNGRDSNGGRNVQDGRRGMGQGSHNGSGPVNTRQGKPGRGNSGRGNPGRSGSRHSNSNMDNYGRGSRWNNN